MNAHRLSFLGIALAIAAISVGIMFFLYHLLFDRPLPNRQFVIGIAPWSDSAEADDAILGFQEALAEAGFIDGEKVAYVIDNAFSGVEEQERIIQSFADKPVDLVFSLSAPGTMIAKRLLSDVPIVFTLVPYPQESGLIASQYSSGNNLVGVRQWVSARIQISLADHIPFSTRRIGFVHGTTDPTAVMQKKEWEAAAKKIDREIVDIGGGSIEEILAAFAVKKHGVDALYLSCDTLVSERTSAARILAASGAARIPALSCFRSGVESGAVFGVIHDPFLLGKKAGRQAARVLRGAHPASLETETPDRPLIAINADAAARFGIVIPPDLLAQSDFLYKENPE